MLLILSLVRLSHTCLYIRAALCFITEDFRSKIWLVKASFGRHFSMPSCCHRTACATANLQGVRVSGGSALQDLLKMNLNMANSHEIHMNSYQFLDFQCNLVTARKCISGPSSSQRRKDPSTGMHFGRSHLLSLHVMSNIHGVSQLSLYGRLALVLCLLRWARKFRSFHNLMASSPSIFLSWTC